MSARLLKKVLKEQEQLEQEEKRRQEEEQLDDDESDSFDSGGRSSKNPFDLLNDDDDDDDPEPNQGNGTSFTDTTSTGSKDKQVQSLSKSTINVVSNSNQKSKKKKMKKNKEGASSNAHKIEAPLDAALENFSLDVNLSILDPGLEKIRLENAKVHDNFLKQSASPILQVDPKYLNVENELRRIFGSKVVKSFEKSNQSGSSRQARGGRRGCHHIRKTILVYPSDHWPRWDGSFSMEFLESKDGGYHHFRYVHSSSYSRAQRAFQAAQAIHDLNGVASVLLYNPYHLDSLITMADYFRFAGEHQMSADAIAKCLYALECAWHPMFTPFLGNCQLKFHHETNKPLFTTLFSHMKNMDRRGCHRSALEVCKLLLSLDVDDSMGALFCIDYFALRAGEYTWLERFSEEYKNDNSLWLFPNFSYSLAVCRFYLEQEQSSQDSDMDATKATSADLMKQALMLHPSVLKKLVAKVPLKDQAWTKILKHSFFHLDQTRIPSLDHLINIYVERSYMIWRLPDLQKLLKNSAQLAIEMLDLDGSDAKNWACVRKEAFPSEKNEYPHLMVQDFSDSMPTLPPDNLQNFIADMRMREGAQNGDQIVNPVDRGHPPPPHDIANRNPLAVLFESILPWVNYSDGRDGAGIDEDDPLHRHGGGNEDH